MILHAKLLCVHLSDVRLLLSVLPYVMSEKEVALKGGTAINFFHLV